MAPELGGPALIRNRAGRLDRQIGRLFDQGRRDRLAFESGFGGIGAEVAGLAQLLFFVFLIACAAVLFVHYRGGRGPGANDPDAGL